PRLRASPSDSTLRSSTMPAPRRATDRPGFQRMAPTMTSEVRKKARATWRAVVRSCEPSSHRWGRGDMKYRRMSAPNTTRTSACSCSLSSRLDRRVQRRCIGELLLDGKYQIQLPCEGVHTGGIKMPATLLSDEFHGALA